LTTHGESNDCSSTRVDTTTERYEIAIHTRTTKVVPHPTSRTESVNEGSMTVATKECGEANSRNFLFRLVEAYFDRFRSIGFDQMLALPNRQSSIHFDPLIGRRLNSLHLSRAGSSVRANIFNIDCCSNDFYIIQRELRALSYDLTVHCDETATVVV